MKFKETRKYSEICNLLYFPYSL